MSRYRRDQATLRYDRHDNKWRLTNLNPQRTVQISLRELPVGPEPTSEQITAAGQRFRNYLEQLDLGLEIRQLNPDEYLIRFPAVDIGA